MLDFSDLLLHPRFLVVSQTQPYTVQVSPAFLMYFLQAELTMNECARRRKWVEHARQQNARDEKFLSH